MDNTPPQPSVIRPAFTTSDGWSTPVNRTTSSVQLILLLAPLFVIFIVGRFLCPMNESANNDKQPFTPPPVVFGVVWTVLALMLSIAGTYALNRPQLTTASQQSVYAFTVLCYAGISVSLAMWLAVYTDACNSVFNFGSYSKTSVALWIFLPLLTCTFGALALTDNKASRAMLAPLLAWSLFAMLLNAFGAASAVYPQNT